MKKFVSLCFALILVLALSACEEAEKSKTTQLPETTSSASSNSSFTNSNAPYLGKWCGDSIAIELMQKRSILELLPEGTEYKEENHAAFVEMLVASGYSYVGYDKVEDYINESDAEALHACQLTLLDTGIVIMKDTNEQTETSREYKIVYDAEQLFSETDDTMAICFYYETSTETLYMNSDLGILSFTKENN